MFANPQSMRGIHYLLVFHAQYIFIIIIMHLASTLSWLLHNYEPEESGNKKDK